MHSITAAFIEASTRLGFTFGPDFAVTLPDGTIVETLGFIHNFGGPRGMVLYAAASEPPRMIQEAVSAAGYYSSVLYPSYERYDETLFKDTLDDWQFFGDPSKRPPWYSGNPWS